MVNMVKIQTRTFLPRQLELSNDVEKNPGPPKVIKNGLIPPGSGSKDRTSNKMAEKAETSRPPKENGVPASSASKATPPVIVDDGLSASSAHDFESLRQGPPRPPLFSP